jgi:GNAT superfamily N-acetyltransferase
VKDYPEKGRWIIGLLIIDPEERGKGIGRVVHEELYRWVESLGALSLRVVVINDNMNGFKFWSSLGYRTKKESVRDYKAKKHAIHIMELNIG